MLATNSVVPTEGSSQLPPLRARTNSKLSTHHSWNPVGSFLVPTPSAVSPSPTASASASQALGSKRLQRESRGGPEFGRQKSVLHPAMVVRRFRTVLMRLAWYRDKRIIACRVWMQSKEFALFMVVALMAALFLPDLWIIFGVSSSVVLDVILTIVMVAFALELCVLVMTDPTYPLSFFFLMDIIGTVSMIFDISYMLGSPADRAVVAAEGEAESNTNLMFLRASRAAKIGARAGRLTRVVRILQFLPFLSSSTMPDQTQGIAKVISSQLCNLLATRIACSTILLVMVIPVFDILTFPQVDYGLSSWVARLAVSYHKGRSLELSLLNEFYEGTSYGPYDACFGYADGDKFVCEITRQELDPSWVPVFQKPSRLASAMQIHDQGFMVAYNLHEPDAIQATAGIINIILMLCIMVFSGLALSSVLTTLAVHPLERMLAKVREIATTVFKFSADIIEESWDFRAEPVDMNTTSEMKLLEKVVQKLAVLAQLQTAEEPMNTEDMGDEDVGVLNMMKGRSITNGKAKMAPRGTTFLGLKKAKMEELGGLSEEVFHSWSFNSLTLSKHQLVAVALCDITDISGEGTEFESPAAATLQRFIHAVEQQYKQNPFHNFAHAVDVVHIAARMMRLMRTDLFLSELEHFSLLIAAVGHDVGHPGVNNGFLQEVGDEIALQYNDKSPLENMHCSKLYSIVRAEDTNVFQTMTKDQYKECRKVIVETILHTDMIGHGTMVKDLQVLFHVNYEVFSSAPAGLAPSPNSPSPVRPGEVEIFNRETTKSLSMCALLHAADVSNPCRSWQVTQMWAYRCLDEFFAQGDREKEQGIPVQFLNDRDKLNKPNSQVGFIEFMIAPFFAANVRLWPGLEEMGSNLSSNIQKWMEEWMKESNPPPEECEKVSARVAKVQAGIDSAMARAE